MKYKLVVAVIGLAAVAVVGTVQATPTSSAPSALSSAPVSPAPVFYWSTEARRAIVPPSAGSENFGNKFPGEAAVYMGIVHVSIYDAAVAIEGGYQPYAIALSAEYAEDFNQVKDLGRFDSTTRTDEQTSQALFWTDHDIRQWNDGMLRLAAARGLDLVQTARMLAMAHVAGGDAMIACFDAKYHYWFWRPNQAIPQADTDGNPATVADPAWMPLRTTPNFPEYPSAHACHSTAVVEALAAFFGTDKVPFSLDSRVTGTTREYDRLQDVVKDVDWARVLVGFHFRNSDEQGSALGRKVGRYLAAHNFQPLG